jgi:hypothetical protein
MRTVLPVTLDSAVPVQVALRPSAPHTSDARSLPDTGPASSAATPLASDPAAGTRTLRPA